MSVEYPSDQTINHAAYERLKPEIDRRYPAGQFVAIYDGCVVANAPTFEQLFAGVKELTTRPRDVFVVQAGVDYPKEATIFAVEKPQ